MFEIGFGVLGALCLVAFVRNARPGRWGPDYAGEMRRPDVVMVATGVVLAFRGEMLWAIGAAAVAAALTRAVFG